MKHKDVFFEAQNQNQNQN